MPGILVASPLYCATAAYFYLPWPDLRIYSGPPPVFAFGASIGTGFFLDASGYILTNRHVVERCRRITVAGSTFRAARAQLTGVPGDPSVDLAMLRVSIQVPATLAFSDEPWPAPRTSGETIPPEQVRQALRAAGAHKTGNATTLGYPGTNRGETPESTPVQVLDDASSHDNAHWLRKIDGVLRQGSSGSPVLDGLGNVIGIVTQATADLDGTTHRMRPGDMVETNHGLQARHGSMIPAAIGLAFAKASGLDPASRGGNTNQRKSASPAAAVVRVFRFQSLPDEW